MAIIRIPTDQPNFSAAMAAAQPGDTIQIEPGASAPAGGTVSVNDLTIDNDLLGYQTSFALGAGVIGVHYEGRAIGAITDNGEDNIITASRDTNRDGAVTVVVTGGNDQVDLAERGNRNALVAEYGFATQDIGISFTDQYSTSGTLGDGGDNSVTFSGILNFKITTGSGNDTITLGSGVGHKITTGFGDDTINVGIGRHVISAGAGADTITTSDGGGPSRIDGGSGVDYWIADLSALSAWLGSVNGSPLRGVNLRFDTPSTTYGDGSPIVSIERVNLRLGGASNSVVTNTGLYDDTINGSNSGVDTVTVFGGHDVVNGGGGFAPDFDTLIVNYGSLTTAVTTTNSSGRPVAYDAGATTSVTFSGIEKYVVTTGSGADAIGTGGGLATVDGGAGADLWIANFTGAAAAIALDLNQSSIVQSLGNGSSVVNVERIDITAGGASTIVTKTGNPNDGLNDTVRGGAAVDVVTVGGGLDLFDGDGGVDTLIVDYATETAAIVTTGDPTTRSGQYGDGANTGVTFTGVEQFRITTGSGADVITTGDGDDFVQSQGGTDTLNGNGGSDTVSYAEKTASVVVTLDGANAVNVTVGGAVEDTIRNFENIIAGSGDDGLTGDAGANRFDGGGGADVMTGGLGDDIYVVDNLFDKVVELRDGGTDTVLSSVTFVFAGPTSYAENLTLTGAAQANGIGNTLFNTIIGNSATNFLDGKAGRDTLTGGLGNDRFQFTTALDASKNVDHIVDFSFAAGNNDQIALENAVFTALGAGALAAGAFMSNTTGVATQADDRIVYNTSTGDLFYDADGLNGAAGVRFAILDNHGTLTASDFLII